MISIRVTRGHMADVRTSSGEVSLSLFGHCEERPREGRPGEYDVVPVAARRLSHRARGTMHRVAGRSGVLPVVELVMQIPLAM